MSELPERLRDWAGTIESRIDVNPQSQLLRDAADEIELLKADCDVTHEELVKAEAEIERLRETNEKFTIGRSGGAYTLVDLMYQKERAEKAEARIERCREQANAYVVSAEREATQQRKRAEKAEAELEAAKKLALVEVHRDHGEQ